MPIPSSLGSMRIGIAAIALQLSGWSYASTEKTKAVLIVNSSEVLSSSAQAVDPAMYEVLSSSEHKLEILSEHLILHTASPGQLKISSLDLMRKKYSERSIDLVIARWPRALEFVDSHEDYLWPGMPAMYYLASDAAIYRGTYRRPLGCAFIDHNTAGNVALLLHLQPADKRIVQLLFTSRPDEFFSMDTALNATVKSIRDDILVETRSGAALLELSESIVMLPRDTAFLAIAIDHDEDGDRYALSEMLKKVSAGATAPFHGMRGSHMGKGTVGGQVIDLRKHGRQAAMPALKILAMPSMGPTVPESQMLPCVVDDHQIRQRNFDFSSPLFTCERLFSTLTFWDRYKAQIAAFMAMSLVIFLLIISLQWQRKRRLAAEDEINRQRVALTHVARLGSIGELTASIVHEINQPLGAILANADAASMILSRQTKPNFQLSAILSDIRDENLRVSQIIKKLRVLLSKRSLELKPVSLNDIVDACKSLLGNLAIRHHAAINTALADDLPLIMGDNIHLQQVLINLASNAMEAMNAVSPAQKILSLRTEKSDIDHVSLIVTDRGTGIPTTIRPEIFTSFYTTKSEGMGMGLAIVQTIVETHNGSIETFNNENGGTTFVVTFPIANGFSQDLDSA